MAFRSRVIKVPCMHAILPYPPMTCPVLFFLDCPLNRSAPGHIRRPRTKAEAQDPMRSSPLRQPKTPVMRQHLPFDIKLYYRRCPANVETLQPPMRLSPSCPTKA